MCFTFSELGNKNALKLDKQASGIFSKNTTNPVHLYQFQPFFSKPQFMPSKSIPEILVNPMTQMTQMTQFLCVWSPHPPTKLHPETLRLTLGSVWFSPVKLGWQVGGVEIQHPGEEPRGSRAKSQWIKIWLVRCWKLEKSQIWCWMTFNFRWLRWYLKLNLSSKAYTLLNIAKSNIETRIRKRKFPKKGRKSCYWKDHPTSEKKTLEMYKNIYP